jgi:hypothetical protein
LLDSGKFWEIMATVIPVIALAFVLEVRYLRLEAMGPFRRLVTTLAHAGTILVLLFSELAALNNLAGSPQADWAVPVAVNGCAAGLAVVLSGPAAKLLIVGIYGTSFSSYKGYWRVSRLLRKGAKQVKVQMRILRQLQGQEKRILGIVTALDQQGREMPAGDLHTIWAKELHEARVEDARRLQEAIRADIARAATLLRAAIKRQRKTERKIIKMAGGRTRSMLRAFEREQV